MPLLRSLAESLMQTPQEPLGLRLTIIQRFLIFVPSVASPDFLAGLECRGRRPLAVLTQLTLCPLQVASRQESPVS